MIAAILPPCAASYEAYSDTDDAVLLPEENAIVARASESRRRRFTTARACARHALSELGQSPVPILADQRGAPCWPTGIVGSITHCAGYRAAAVAKSEAVLCIGIDAEPNESLPRGVLQRIASDEERVGIHELVASEPRIAWDRLLFSAKEAVYKAWYPLTGRWLDFKEAAVVFDPVAVSFRVQLLVPGPRVFDQGLAGYAGRWIAENGLVITAVSVPRPHGRPEWLPANP
jgi:4'-phosphopantetheinyl transferase EntD